MPLYEYECNGCGVRFERLQSINDEPIKKCPECGEEVRRLIQPVGIIFKGKGFYVTDNRSKAKSSTAVPGIRDDTKSEKPDKSEKKKEGKSKSED